MSVTAETVADEVEEKPERSIREELESARDEVVARQEKENVVSNDERISADGKQRADSTGEPAAGPPRARDAHGKFASADPNRPDPAASASALQSVQPAQSLQPAGAPGPAVALPPPNGWKAEEKAFWAKVPPEVQHVIQRRETDVARKIAEQDEVRLVGNNFMQAANEFAPVIQARGGNPVALFREVLGIISQIHNSPPANRAQLFRQLAAQNGADLSALGITPAQNAPGQQPPNVPIDQLVQRQVNEQFQALQRQQAQERERAEMETTNREIEAFRSKVDANGQSAYPYFDHVTSLMASILGGGAAATLEEAYQLAVKAHPETSQLIAKAAEVEAKAKEEARRKAEAARRKAGSLRVGAGNSPSIPQGNRTIRDELKAAFAEANSRI